MKLSSWCNLVLLALCLSAAPASISAQEAAAIPAAPGSPALAKVEAAYQKDLHDKVDAVLDPLEKRLNDLYRANLDSEGKKAIGQGSLDAALAFQNEAKRFAAENNVPEQDEPGTQAGLAKVRAAYRAEAKRLAQQRAAGRQTLLTAYLANLRALEVELTRAAKLDDALAVRRRATELAAQVPSTPSPLASHVTPTPAAPANTPRPLVSSSSLGALADKVDLYVVGKDTAFYADKKIGAKPAARERPSQLRVSLHAGDVISVKVGEGFHTHNFWLCGVTPAGDFLFETSPEWRAYLPADRIAWWEIKKRTKDVAAESVPGVDAPVHVLMKSASVTPCYRGALPIRSPIDDTGSPYPGSFFYHIITKEDLRPKKIDPATRVDGTAAAQPFLGKTVRLITANKPTLTVVIENDEVKIAPLDQAAPDAAGFKVTSGSEPGTVHFESVARPGFYLSANSNTHNGKQLEKGLFPSSNFWIEKAPGAEGFVIAGHLSPTYHLGSDPKGAVTFNPRLSNGDDVFLIQRVPAAK